MKKPGFEKKLKYLPLTDLRIDDSFWNRYMVLVTQQIIPYQYASLCDQIPDAPPSRCVRNLRIAAGLENGDFEGFVFQDTDLAKWLEAVAYSLAYAPDPKLEQTADEMIRLVGMAQEDNGYLDSYYSIRHPGKQFCNLKEGHELYTAGHFIEAAVAYFLVTGKDEFLKIMCDCADNICRVFHQEDYLDAVPGHEEIELALIRLWEVTGKSAYRDMALEFVNRRGTTDYLSREHTLDRFIDCWYDRNPYIPQYGQAHKPVREQDTAEGHAVRALYLYSAMADLAGCCQDEDLFCACERLYDNIVNKRMYITGSVGSSGVLERFTSDYDLPNDTNYSESCASIALAMFCKRMARITGDAKYIDTAELALYNTVTAGVALDGKSFFYVNPLEVVPSACISGTDKNHVKPQRQKWFGCACCPPNIARTLASLGEYLFFQDDESLWVNMFVSGTYRASITGNPATITVESQLPYQGAVRFLVTIPEKSPGGSIRIRIPSYARNPWFTCSGTEVVPRVEKGYAEFALTEGETEILMRFDMPPQLIYADPRVPSDAGKCAVKLGPLVYCLEEADNGETLSALMVDRKIPLQAVTEPTLLGGTVTVTAAGRRLVWDNPELYSTEPPRTVPCTLKFVPYCYWGNRKPGQEMVVWVKYMS